MHILEKLKLKKILFQTKNCIIYLGNKNLQQLNMTY